VKLPTDLNKIWAFAARSLLVNRRNVFAVFEMLFWPMIGILSVGLLTQFLNLDADIVTFVLIGAVSMNVIQIAQLDLSYSLLYDVWSKSLKHKFIAPISLGHVLVGAGLVGLLRGFLVFLVMGLLSMWLFNMDLSRPGPWVF
jgi:ABC-2 type transport system permease protein